MAIFCGIDCGFQGGISIVFDDIKKTPLVYKMPVIKTTKKIKGKNKIKTVYNLLEIRKIFKENLDKNSLIVLEKVAPHVGEGSVSSFNFGRGYGDLEGLIVGLFNKTLIEASPQKWKKHFPELINDVILKKREEIKELRIIGKKLEEKEEKKQNKKEIDKINRQIKKEAKKNARELVSKLYPALADKFEKVNTDGMAESLLIAIFGKEKQSELVQNS